jgi:predicted HNH restriction endonuclease
MQDDPKLEAGGAYLLTWQPKRFNLDLQGIVKRFNRGKLGLSEWATGSTKTVRLGAPFFFLRQGLDRPGIIGWGRIYSPVRSQRHWDPVKARAGAKSNEVDINFEFITMPDDLRAIPRSVLQSDRGTKAGKWDIQGSGTRLTAEVTSGVRALLRARRVRVPSLDPKSDVPPVRVEVLSEAGVKQVLTTRHERNRKARMLCLKHYSCVCHGCGFDFGLYYGPDANGMIEVHHLRPISQAKESSRVDPIKDLRPLCPNCHRVVHLPGRDKEPLSIQTLRAMVRRYGVRSR